MPLSGARLGGTLNPLSSRAATQRGKEKSLTSSAAADLFLDSLPASTEARASAPSPCPPWRVSRQASRAGEHCSALSLCAGISPFFPLRPCCCGICADSRGSRPSVGSALIAVARARLWSSFRRRSESPLLARRETKRQEKVSCLFGSCRLFPGLPPG